MTEEIKRTLLDILKYLVISLIPVLGLSFALSTKPFAFMLGVLIGALTSYLAFVELALTMTKAVKMTSGRSAIYVNAKYYMRLIIYGLVIYASIKAPYIDVYGTVTGLLLVKLVIYITNIFFTKKSKRKED